jgi:hypothetical protein
MDWQTELPAYYQARGCRLYEYDLGRRRERRLPRLAITGSSQFLPSLWKGAIAFAARRDSRRAEIMLRRASLRSGRSLPVPRGPRGTDTSVDDSALLAIDMRGTRVTYAWESFRDECPQPPADSGDVDGIRVDLISVGQRRSILKTTCNYLRPGLVGAPQYPGAVATVQEDFAGPGVWSGTVKRFPSSSSDPMLGAPDNVISFALDGSSTAIFASHPVDGSDVAITRTGG